MTEKNEKYFVVEARLPVQINDADSVKDAALKAAQIIEREYGVNLSNWFLRIFEYGGDVDQVGPIAEYFSNPAGSKFREISENILIHESYIKEGKSPNEQQD